VDDVGPGRPKGGPRAQINLGVIGVGTIGRLQIDLLNQSNAANLRVIASADPCVKLTESDVVPYRDYRELLMRDDIDVVSINTPPSSHYGIAVDALNAGKDVLVEKPPALNSRQCREMINLADERHRVLFMAFHARYHTSIDELRHRLRGQEIARLDMTYRENVRNYHNPSEWIFDPRIAGGGVLMDSGINAISVATHTLTPGFKYKIERVGLVYLADRSVDIAATVKFTIGRRGRGHLNMDWLHEGPEHRMIKVATTTGHEYSLDLISDELRKNGVVVKNGGITQQARVDQRSEYKALYEDFADHIVARRSSVSDTEVAFIEDAYRMARPVNAGDLTVGHIG
jgi:D-galactose 1-dehydrogenase